jgi:hypothetical protein
MPPTSELRRNPKPAQYFSGDGEGANPLKYPLEKGISEIAE